MVEETEFKVGDRVKHVGRSLDSPNRGENIVSRVDLKYRQVWVLNKLAGGGIPVMWFMCNTRLINSRDTQVEQKSPPAKNESWEYSAATEKAIEMSKLYAELSYDKPILLLDINGVKSVMVYSKILSKAQTLGIKYLSSGDTYGLFKCTDKIGFTECIEWVKKVKYAKWPNAKPVILKATLLSI